MIISAALRSILIKRIAQLLVAFLFSIFYFLSPVAFGEGHKLGLFSISAAHAAEPTPLPCQQPQPTDERLYTYNWQTNGQTKEPLPDMHKVPVTVTGPSRDITVTHYFDFDVDFSKLSALFAPVNSNYLDGSSQDEQHRSEDIIELSPAQFSKYPGVIQKASPRSTLDPLKVKYVQYITQNPTLAESANLYTDIYGQNPKTINDMTIAFGTDPQPPTMGGNKDAWQSSWGLYWDKIPTAYSEFYQAQIVFREESHSGDANQDGQVDPGQIDYIQRVLDGFYCPDEIERKIDFVMPEFFRTAALSGQANRLIVPKAAQSKHTNDLILGGYQGTAQNESVLAKFIDTCLKVFKKTPFSSALEKVISFVNILNPVQDALALDPQPDCIRVPAEGKEGQDPYCALPANQLDTSIGENCTNQQDIYKLDKDNPNVNCHFKILWQKVMHIPNTDPSDPNSFDECHRIGDNYYSCTVYVSVWPIFKIPWQTEIMNNAIFSDSTQSEPLTGSALDQVKGRPGVYSFVTPRAVFEDSKDKLIHNLQNLIYDCEKEQRQVGPNQMTPTCQKLVNLASPLDPDNAIYPGFGECYQQYLQNDYIGPAIFCAKNTVLSFIASLEKKKPGETDQLSEDDAKLRFNGGWACNREFVVSELMDNAVWPELGMNFDPGKVCHLLAAIQQPDQGSQPPVEPPGNFPPTDDNCDGTYSLDNPLGNFGDPNCDFDIDPFFVEVDRLDPTNTETWSCLALYESGFNPNAYNPNATAGQAFGLFQMGHAAYPQYGLDYQIADPGTEFDRGDVQWKVQIANAINYNNQLLGGDFFNDQGVSYWEPINSGLC